MAQLDNTFKESVPTAAIPNLRWKEPVATPSALPMIGNVDGDVRETLTPRAIYSWDAATFTWAPLSIMLGNTAGAALSESGGAGTATTGARSDHSHPFPTAAQVGAAPTTHDHAISEVEGLQTALDGKAASSHTHTIGNVTGLQAALDGKAASSHTHTIGNITGLQTALDGKAASSHSHTQAQSHGSADTDSSINAIHHTLGPGPNQAAPGNHTHDGYAPPNGNSVNMLRNSLPHAYANGLASGWVLAKPQWTVYEPTAGGDMLPAFTLTSTSAMPGERTLATGYVMMSQVPVGSSVFVSWDENAAALTAGTMTVRVKTYLLNSSLGQMQLQRTVTLATTTTSTKTNDWRWRSASFTKANANEQFMILEVAGASGVITTSSGVRYRRWKIENNNGASPYTSELDWLSPIFSDVSVVDPSNPGASAAYIGPNNSSLKHVYATRLAVGPDFTSQNGDISASRGNGQGVVFLGASDRYLYADLSFYELPFTHTRLHGLWMFGDIFMRDLPLYFRHPGDGFHGIRFESWIDGPVLRGNGGVAMVRNSGGQNARVTSSGLEVTSNANIYCSAGGRWAFQSDGNLVWYNSAGQAKWAMYANGTKSFLMPHPTRPGKTLRHAAIESNEAAVYYRGRSRLVDGRAVVQLPEYFWGLTRGITITYGPLTPIGKPDALYISREADDSNTFEVASADPTSDALFTWEIKAERADQHPYLDEVDEMLVDPDEGMLADGDPGYGFDRITEWEVVDA